MKRPDSPGEKGGGTKTPELNMTSMIDVIFLLLIFFVFTSNFDEIEKLLPMNLSLPGEAENRETAKRAEPVILDEIRIRIETDGPGKVKWVINRRECRTPEELADALRKLSSLTKEIPVVIDPVDDVSAEQFLDVYDLCRVCGLVKIQFAVREKKP